MSLEMRDIRSELRAMEQFFEDLFQGFTGRRRRQVLGIPGLGWPGQLAPSTDVFAHEGDLMLRMEIPGMDPTKDVTVEIDDGELLVRGKREDTKEIKQEDYYRKESWYGSFERRFPLPEGTREEDIQATSEKGVLELTIRGAAKALEEPQKPTRKAIPIKSQ